MRKLAPLLFVLMTLSLISCQKKYQCVCTDANGNTTVGGEVLASSRTKADSRCGALSNSSTSTCKAQ